MVGRVKAGLPANVNREPYDVPEDGYATYLKPGTPAYSVEDYAPSFRLAVSADNGWAAYETVRNPNARTAEELLDIRGKVEHVVVRKAPTTGAGEATPFRSPAEVREFVEAVLDSPPERVFVAPATGIYLVFELKDGTEVVRAYEPASGQLRLEEDKDTAGVVLPEEMSGAIAEAAEAFAPANEH